jgi:hypothetical protein
MRRTLQRFRSRTAIRYLCEHMRQAHVVLDAALVCWFDKGARPALKWVLKNSLGFEQDELLSDKYARQRGWSGGVVCGRGVIAECSGSDRSRSKAGRNTYVSGKRFFFGAPVRGNWGLDW